jgi:hypothetical protein
MFLCVYNLFFNSHMEFATYSCSLVKVLHARFM